MMVSVVKRTPNTPTPGDRTDCHHETPNLPKKKAQPPAAHPGSQGRPFASCSSLPLPLLRPDWGNNLHRMGSLLSFSPLGTLHFDYQLISLSSPATLLLAPTLWWWAASLNFSCVWVRKTRGEQKSDENTWSTFSCFLGWVVGGSSRRRRRRLRWLGKEMSQHVCWLATSKPAAPSPAVLCFVCINGTV